jgi:hypothetical protein
MPTNTTGGRVTKRSPALSRAELDALVEEATVDAYGDGE